MMKKIEQYNQTPQALENFDDQFGKSDRQGDDQKKYGDITKFNREQQTTAPAPQQRPSVPVPQPQPSAPASEPVKDPLAGFLKNMLLGQLNPIPGV